MKEYLAVGYVQRPHALKGELTVEPLTDDNSRYKKLKEVYVQEGKEYISYEVESTRISGGKTVLLKLKGIDSVEAADKFRSVYFYVPRKDAVPLEDGQYYYADIIGCKAVMEDTGEVLGTVYDIIETPNNDAYCVKTKKGDVCIPAMKQFIRVDVENSVIYIFREGLEELLE